jgi:cytochrome c
MYMLEYGSVYGADNTDARLVKIEYNAGNRPPVARLRVVDSAAQALIDQRVFLTSERRGARPITEVAGEVPLRVLFNSMGTSDPDDDDAITYEWKFDGKTPSPEKKPMPVYTYREPGTYYAILTVKDKAGLTGSDTVIVRAGNQKPRVSINSSANKSFFWDTKKAFPYTVQVSDKEDGRIDAKAVQVTYEYNPKPAAMTIGAALIAGSDCKACHTENKVSVGPSYLAVAQRYKAQPDAVQKLSKKIIAGGGGSWGTEHVMSAHPQFAEQETAEMVKYILGLAESKNVSGTLPLQGSLALNKHAAEDVQGFYTLTATYTDKGANGIQPLTQTDVITLRPAKVRAVYADVLGNWSRFGNNLGNADHKSYLLFKNIDLTGIHQLVYQYSSLDKSGHIELRLDSHAGPVVSKVAYTPTTRWDSTAYVTGVIPKPIEGRHDLYIFTVKPEKPNEDIVKLTSIEFKP